MFKQSLVLTVIISLFFMSLLNAETPRVMTLLEVRPGPGVNEKESKLIEKKILNILKNKANFMLKDRDIFESTLKDRLDCEDDECLMEVALDIKIDLLFRIKVRKKRNNTLMKFELFDSELAASVLDNIYKYEGNIANMSNATILGFLKDLDKFAQIVQKEDEVKEVYFKKVSTSTVLSGNELTGVLTADKSPYLMTKNMIVPSGKTLTIKPGVTILVGGDYSGIVVYGQIIAEGTSLKPIIIKSVKKDPKNWDWDRIYFRSKANSVLKNVQISHSNFGICVENGSLTLNECKFTNNSIQCLYARDSRVAINNCYFGKGHITAINAAEGAIIDIDTGYIAHNGRGIICQNYSKVSVRKTNIIDNDYGIVVDGKAEVDLKSVKVTLNRVGILSKKPIADKKLFMISGNTKNVKIGDNGEYEKVISNPLPIKWVTLKTKPFTDTNKVKPGFVAMSIGGDSFLDRYGLIGSIAMGFIGRDISDNNISDSVYQTTYVPGIIPTAEIFLQSRVGDRETNLNVNVKGEKRMFSSKVDKVNTSKIENFNFNTTLGKNASLILGDFNYDKSEISVSSKKIRGIKYSGSFNRDKIIFDVMGGESERPELKGDYNVDQFDSVTTNKAQELIALANLSADITKNLNLSAHFITTTDLDTNFFLSPVFSDDEVNRQGVGPNEFFGDQLIRSFSGGIKANMILNNSLSMYAEIDLGKADTMKYDTLKENIKNGDTSYSYKKYIIEHDYMAFDPTKNIAGQFGVDYGFYDFSGNFIFTVIRDHFYTGGNASISPAQVSIHTEDYLKSAYTIGRYFEVNKALKSVEWNFDVDFERYKELFSIGDSIKPEEIDYNLLTLSTNAKFSILKKLDITPKFTYAREFRNRELYDTARINGKLTGLFNANIEDVYNKIKLDLAVKYKFTKNHSLSFSTSYETKNSAPLDNNTKGYTDADTTIFGEYYLFFDTTVNVDTIANDTTSSIDTAIAFSPNGESSYETYGKLKLVNKSDGYKTKTKISLSNSFYKRRLIFKTSYEFSLRRDFDNDWRKTYFVWGNSGVWEMDDNQISHKIKGRTKIVAIPRKLIFSIKGSYALRTRYENELIDGLIAAEEVNSYEEQISSTPQKAETLVKYTRFMTGTEEDPLKEKLYNMEIEAKYILTNKINTIIQAGIEHSSQKKIDQTENYDLYWGGFMVNFLF